MILISLQILIMNIELVKAVSTEVAVPIIASGGMGKPEHLLTVVKEGGADAVAMADILHYNRAEMGTIRAVAEKNGLGAFLEFEYSPFVGFLDFRVYQLFSN